MKRFLFPIICILSSLASSSYAAVVFTINISNPAVTVITAVNNNSQSAGVVPVGYDGGIAIRNFFTANTLITVPVSITGNWTAIGTTRSYNEMVTFAYGSPDVVSGVDLSVYHSVASADTQKFVTTAAPFQGSSVLNLSNVANLPAIGATGNVFSSYQNGAILGQWVVIPEPSVSLLSGIALLGFLRRRR